ncbi:hypothetical protein BaRGS_00017666 [Batillaria attramentaria]|uniref:Uncharacterized protein n=1 Tax=Batillaria attramentaria TaxID=370345 RepID=A0ABD0KV24_9CAEN
MNAGRKFLLRRRPWRNPNKFEWQHGMCGQCKTGHPHAALRGVPPGRRKEEGEVNGHLPENSGGKGNFTTAVPLPDHTSDGKDFFHHLTLKDETTFVALIVMGVIVPAVFVIVFLLICRQRRKDMLARRTQMLLQNAQDFALDDYTTEGKTTAPIVKTGGFQTI